MEYNEFILIGIGTAISVLGYFLKRENKRLEGIELLVNQINITLAKNEVRDSERNRSIEKRLEDRRVDIRKLYDLVQKK
jgi:pyrimidine operon attenuation protein/uracil phosphoribosyltransferase